MVKIFSKILTAGLVLALLLNVTGCAPKQKDKDSGGGEISETSSQTSSTVAKTDSSGIPEKYKPDPNKQYTFSWTSYQMAPLDSDPYILRYFEEKFNVKFDLWYIDMSKYAELIALRVASGEVPDLFRIQPATNFLNYYEQNILMEIPRDVLEYYAPEMVAHYKELIGPDVFTKYYNFDGGLYGIPVIQHKNIYRKPVLYRGDWLKNVGMEKEPDTIEEFEKAMYAFAHEDPDRNGKKDTYGLSKEGMSVVYGAYGYQPNIWTEKDGRLVFGGIQPEMKEALGLLRKWYADKVLDPEFVTGEKVGSLLGVPFIQGRIGFTCAGAFHNWVPSFPGRMDVSPSRAEMAKLNPKAVEELVFGKPPAGPNGARGVLRDKFFGDLVYSFGKQLEKEPDKFSRLLQVINDIHFVSLEENATAYYGMEGRDWKLNEYGTVDPVNPNWKALEASKKGGHIVLQCFNYGPMDFKPSPVFTEWMDKHYFREYGMMDALINPLPSISKYKAELDKLREEAYTQIITGDKPLEYFDEYVQKWKKAGGEILEKEANSEK
ncbi:MAG: extracellular solute-binding protein [Firmicutes bacterium]|nr:extracellular solute-binding protein [Bacillota bacterium]